MPCLCYPNLAIWDPIRESSCVIETIRAPYCSGFFSALQIVLFCQHKFEEMNISLVRNLFLHITVLNFMWPNRTDVCLRFEFLNITLVCILAGGTSFSSPFPVCQSSHELRNFLILNDLICAISTLMFKTSVIISLIRSGGMECLQHFLLEQAKFSRRLVWMDWICRSCSLVFLFWQNRVFSIITLRLILVCSINVSILFSYRIF